MSRLRFLTVVIIASISSGCGTDDGGRHHVKGNATFGGEPIAYGEVVFRPAKGPMGSTVIRDGQFDTSMEGQGVVGGDHQILVTGYLFEPIGIEDETADEAEDQNAPPLFVNYELNGDLSGDTFDLAVPKEAEGHGVDGGAPRESRDP